ncbi:MAG TPA: PP2C family serine/threonine-protein phosphatase [Pseudonocardiaceae bacterium]|jgi:serine/threonine protein phosphatase PrpC
MSHQTCRGCGSSVATGDQYCEVCGLRQPSEADHLERDLGAAAGVTDRGIRHERNEDAFALRAIGKHTIVAVVCDGVSTSDRPDQAARLASTTAADSIVNELTEGVDPETATATAIDAAAKAVTGLADPAVDVDRAPASTYVSAIVTTDAVIVGWLGDSRAGWLAADQTSTSAWLTTDDSWAVDVVASGELDYAQAQADPRSHALTGWLGADAATVDSAAHVVTVRPTGPGVLLLCSDGLWNYRSDPDELAELILPEAPTAPLDAAKTLVRYALSRGGQDNITATVIPFPPFSFVQE